VYTTDKGDDGQTHSAVRGAHQSNSIVANVLHTWLRAARGGLLTQTDLLAESAVTRLTLIFLPSRRSRRTHLFIFYPTHGSVLLPLDRQRVPIPYASTYALSVVADDTCIVRVLLFFVVVVIKFPRSFLSTPIHCRLAQVAIVERDFTGQHRSLGVDVRIFVLRSFM
jgi:hypothetical protein